MTAPLSSSDRGTLSKLLGMIGSDHDGEALAAARKANQFLASKGISWPEALGLDTAPPPPEADHLALARDLLVKGRGQLTAWELSFLRGVMSFKTLSGQQLATLDGIRAKLENIPHTD